MFAEEFVGSGNQLTPEVGASLVERIKLTDTFTNIDTSLLATIEAQLSQSEVYLRAVESLQQLTAEYGIDGQILLKAVSLEAVRLTLQVVNSESSTSAIGTLKPKTNASGRSETSHGQQSPLLAVAPEPVLLEKSTVMGDRGNELDSEAAASSADNDVFEAIASMVHPETPASPKLLTSFFDRYKLKREHAVEEVQVFTRAEILTQIGAQIQLERERKDLSISQLHARTFIPMYHLQALEGGHVEQLPEDVYLRGFLRRIENALGLAVDTLVSKLPSEMEKSVLPCWAGHAKGMGRRGFAGLDVNPTYLYVTYAAIMAGGVYWLSQQSTPTANVPDLGSYEPYVSAPSTRNQTRDQKWLKPKANLSAQRSSSPTAQSKSMQVGSTKNIAPPETLR